MKSTSLVTCLILTLGLPVAGLAQNPPPPATPAAAPAAPTPESELKAIEARISAKLKAGAEDGAAFAAEAADYDALLVKYSGIKTEAVAAIALSRAEFYMEIIEDNGKALALLGSIKTDYPGTPAVAEAEKQINFIGQLEKAKLLQASLIGHPAPALHFQWASRPDLKSLADLKGKVVVLDFWATWCGPCIRSFPLVREHVAHFKDSAVAFVGVTSIQGFVKNLGPTRIDTKGDPAREMALMPDFIKAKNMTWDIAFSEEKVFNPDYGVMGIPYVAILAPDGTVRHAGLNPGDPKADIAGKINAILKEFNLPVPASS